MGLLNLSTWHYVHSKCLVSFILSLSILIIPASVYSETLDSEIQPFKATYEVYRKDKLSGEINSQLIKTGPNHYRLTDVTKGTSGLASFVNFERTEITSFEYSKQQVEVINHSQIQKIAFKTKSFEFSHVPDSKYYEGIYKGKEFVLHSQQNLLSSHLLPWQLAHKICNQQNNFSLDFLKSNTPRTYYFEARAFDNHKTLIERLYDESLNKRTATWVNHDNGCYVSEIDHYDNNEHIRTVLTDIEFYKK